MKGQSRKHSLLEAGINIAIGFSINYFANLLIFPLFGFHISLVANLWMGVIYTAISLIRSYFIRRYFNSWMVRLHVREVAAKAPSKVEGNSIWQQNRRASWEQVKPKPVNSTGKTSQSTESPSSV